MTRRSTSPPGGERLYRDLHEYVSQPTARLLGRFDPGDVDTTVRTLQAITALAAQDMAAESIERPNVM